MPDSASMLLPSKRSYASQQHTLIEQAVLHDVHGQTVQIRAGKQLTPYKCAHCMQEERPCTSSQVSAPCCTDAAAFFMQHLANHSKELAELSNSNTRGTSHDILVQHGANCCLLCVSNMIHRTEQHSTARPVAFPTSTCQQTM
jgi:hypothetical protein